MSTEAKGGMPAHRPPDAEYKSREWLEERYHGDGMYMHEMADEAGVSAVTIQYWMDRLGVEARPRGRTLSADPLEEVRRVAEILGRPPTQLEFDERSEVSYQTLANRFGSWLEARRMALEGE